jgi:hypothetical protein
VGSRTQGGGCWNLADRRWEGHKVLAAVCPNAGRRLAHCLQRFELAMTGSPLGAPPRGGLPFHPGADAPEWVQNCAGRVYLDATGQWWCVSEQPCRASDPPGTTCLVFMSEQVVRRVLTFPQDWRALCAADLEVVSWQR